MGDAKEKCEVSSGVSLNGNGVSCSVEETEEVALNGVSCSVKEKEGEAEDTHLRYGFCGWRPSWLQSLNTPIWLLVFMSSANALRSILVSGLLGSVVTTLEKRFDITSTQSSWIISTYDISALSMLLLVSYVGSKAHRPRWTAVGMLSIALGTIIFTLPHFITGEYKGYVVSDNDTGLCDLHDETDRNCSDGEEETMFLTANKFFAIFILGRLFLGLGAVPLYTLCVTYLDDIVSKETFSLYIGFFYGADVFGVSVGYMFGGYLLTFWGEAGKDTDLSYSDAGWVGAWWPGFIICALFMFLVAIPMAGYARDMPGAANVRASKQSEAYAAGDVEGAQDTSDSKENSELDHVGLKRFVTEYLYSLAKNPAYICLTLFVSFNWIILNGFGTLGPKYVQVQFGQSAAFSAILFGSVAVAGGVSGTVLGGLLVKKRQLTCHAIMKWEAAFSLVIFLLISGVFWLICDSIQLAGVHQSYEGFNDLSSISMSDSCNAQCRCDTSSFTPICDTQTDTQYFSPCHAGCMNSKLDDLGQTQLYNCTCIQRKYELQNITAPDNWHASSNQCRSSDGCTEKMVVWLAVMFLAMILLFACNTMNISATVRCIAPSQTSLAIGAQLIVMQLLGKVPGPIMFGQAYRAACQYSHTMCGDVGSCLAYDNNKIAMLMLAICLSVMGSSLLSMLIGWKLYKPPRQNTDLRTKETVEQQQQFMSKTEATL